MAAKPNTTTAVRRAASKTVTTAVKKAAVKKAAPAKPVAKKAAASKAPAKKAAPAKPVAKKAPASKAPAKKAAASKAVAAKVVVAEKTSKVTAARIADGKLAGKTGDAVVEELTEELTDPTIEGVEQDAEEEVEDGEVPTVPVPIDYNDRNTRLFVKRKQIKDDLNELLAVPEKRRGTRQRRNLSRLTRDLDDITTEIIKFNYGLVRSYTKKFTSNSSRDDSADFEASAVVGLMRAIDSFDPTKGRFGAWAYKPIQREVLRAVRDADFKSMNPGDFERRPDILRAYTKVQGGDEGRIPTNAEVAATAGVTIEQVKRVLEAPHLESLHQRVGEDGDTELGDMIETPDTGVEGSVLSAMTLTALEDYGLSALDDRELFVLVRRFGLDAEPEQKLASIGEMLGLSREAVRQVEAKAIAKITHPVVLRRIIRHGRK